MFGECCGMGRRDGRTDPDGLYGGNSRFFGSGEQS